MLDNGEVPVVTASGRPGGSTSIGPIDSRALIIVIAAVVIGLLLLANGFGDDSTVETTSGGAPGETADDGGDDGAATDAGSDVAATDAGADGASVDGAATDAGTDAAATDAGVTDGGTGGTEPPSAVTHPPAEITVTVVNSSAGESGIAGAMVTTLSTFGYVGLTANGPDASASVIYWTAEYQQDALTLAANLAVPATVVAQLTVDPTTLVDADDAADAAGAQIIIVLGSDAVIRAA